MKQFYYSKWEGVFKWHDTANPPSWPLFESKAQALQDGLRMAVEFLQNVPIDCDETYIQFVAAKRASIERAIWRIDHE